MDLLNKKVMHKAFGKGNISNYNDSYIRINFKSGERRFVFPDVFKKYVTFVDGKATKLVDKKIAKKEEIVRKEEKLKREKIEQEKLLLQEQLDRAKLKKQRKARSVNPRIQSVFWFDADEEEEIFTEWQVFTGEIKSGRNKGQPRKLAQMNGNSAILLTKREDDVNEEDRQISGLFLANEYFEGRDCEDGFIKAHPKYRIHLSEKESQKMLFWNYYVDSKSDDKIIWNSGRQRYYDNILTAQILRDIVALRENSEDKEGAQTFYNHFCKINLINKETIPAANGALIRS